MLFFKKVAIVAQPYWHKGRRERLKVIAIMLANISFVAEMYMVTLPSSSELPTFDHNLNIANTTDMRSCMADLFNTTTAKTTGLLNLTEVQLCLTATLSNQSNATNAQGFVNLQTLLVPMTIGAIQFYIFYNLQADVINAVQQSMIKRIFGAEAGHNLEFSKTIALMQVLDAELAAELKNLGQYIDGATKVFPIFGYFFNIIPMVLYWQMAYTSVPEARNILYIATLITSLVCVIQKIMIDVLTSQAIISQEQNNKWQTMVGEAIRLNKAVVAGGYQLAEARKLQKITNDKSIADFISARYYAGIIVLDNVLSLSLINVMSNIVIYFYPKLNGTERLAVYTFALNFFTNYLLQILYRVGGNLSAALVGLDKLYAITQAIKQIEELLANPKLKFQFGHNFADSNIALQFENVSLAIPVKMDQPEPTPESTIFVKKNLCQKALDTLRCNNIKPKIAAPKSATEKILHVLADNRRVFLLDNNNAIFNKDSLKRIGGSSGVGKSTFFGMLTGLWPYATGTIHMHCQEEQLYYLAQEDLFVEGTLLENIFYPNAIPTRFSQSKEEMQKLHELMQRMNLGEEILRLNEAKNWADPDLSLGTRKRLSALRLIMRAWFAESGSDPKILLLDEPTAGVDPNAGAHVETLLLELTILYPDLCIMFIEHTKTVEHDIFNPVQQEALQKNPALIHGFRAKQFETLNLQRMAKRRNSEVDPLGVLEQGRDEYEGQRLTYS